MRDPLTGGTAGARGMAVSLLTYANRAKVAEALTAGGYPVTRVTVNRWAAGKEMPGIAASMILELFGHEAQQKAPQPEWAGALESRIISEVEATIARLLPPRSDETDDSPGIPSLGSFGPRV